MCDKCEKIDKRLEQYRRMALSVTDDLTIARLNKAIKDITAERAKVQHPDQVR
jgi:hypothetical protein